MSSTRTPPQPADAATQAWNRERHEAYAAEVEAAKAKRFELTQASHERMSNVERMLRYLAPATFCTPPKPLAIGIAAGIFILLDGEMDSGAIAGFLRSWTRRTGYQKALAAGGFRVDIDGYPAGEVTAEHQASAAASLVAQSVAPAEAA